MYSKNRQRYRIQFKPVSWWPIWIWDKIYYADGYHHEPRELLSYEAAKAFAERSYGIQMPDAWAEVKREQIVSETKLRTWTIPTTYQCDDAEDQKESGLKYVELVEKSEYDRLKNKEPHAQP